MNALLEEFSETLSLIEETRPGPEVIDIVYDLLLIYCARIEEITGKRDWTVNTLLKWLDKCIEHPAIAPHTRRDHLLRRSLVLHKHLTFSELARLSVEGYARMKILFNAPFQLSFFRKLKMTLGNAFAGPHNLKILAQIHPYVTQLTLPIGPLKEEYHGFINQLCSDLLSHPRMNAKTAILSLGEGYAADPSFHFDFQEALRLVIYLSDKKMLTTMGDSPDSLDVRAIRAKILLLSQLRVILFTGRPSRIQTALQGKPLLQKTFKAIFLPAKGLRPVYTWGNDLDGAVNDLIHELNGFSGQMSEVIEAPAVIPPAAPRVITWNVMRFWRGAGHAFSSTFAAISGMITNVMPKVNAALQRFMPENKFSLLLENCTPPVYEIIDHSIALAKILEKQGLYNSVTQGLIEPLRDNILAIDLKSLQRAIAIYKHQFEPLLATMLEPNQSPFAVLGKLSIDNRNVLLMNSGMIIRQLRHCFVSVLPILDPRTLGNLHQVLLECEQACIEFDSIIGQMTLLQIFMKKEGEALLSQAIDFLGQSGDVVTAGSATNTALRQSLGSVVGGTLGVVAEKTVDTLNIFQLDLSFNPSQASVHSLPRPWVGKNLKTILREELIQTFAVLKQFNALNLGSQYEASATLLEKSSLRKVS